MRKFKLTPKGKEICLSKVRYKNQQQAIKWCVYYSKLGVSGKYIYKCDYGKHYHLTSNPKAPRIIKLQF